MVRTVSVTSICEREDWSLRPVAVVVRVALPCLISARQWLAVCTGSEVRSLTYMPTSWSRMMSYLTLDRSAFGSRNRSRTFSL